MLTGLLFSKKCGNTAYGVRKIMYPYLTVLYCNLLQIGISKLIPKSSLITDIPLKSTGIISVDLSLEKSICIFGESFGLL